MFFKSLIASLAVLISATSMHGAQIVRFAESVKDEYIVLLVERDPHAVPGLARSIAASYAGELISIYDTAAGGFSIRMTDEAAQRLAADPRVRGMEENAILRLESHFSGTRSVGDPTKWHLDRIDQRYYDGSGNLDGFYQYCTLGTGVVVYVFDSGIFASHRDFVQPSSTSNGQVSRGENFVYPWNDRADAPPCLPSQVNGYHGTSVASLIAGQTNGVAPGVRLVPVRWGSCYGISYADWILSSLNWVISANPSQLAAYSTKPVNPDRLHRPAILNWSGFTSIGQQYPGLGSVEDAVNDLMEEGVVVVAAANNQDDDACLRAPANLARERSYVSAIDENGGSYQITTGRVIVVGGTERNPAWTGAVSQDARLTFTLDGQSFASNYGPCVNIWAPGGDVRIALPDERSGGTGFGVGSGTSFAAPLVTGMIARYLELQGSNYDMYSTHVVDGVWAWLQQEGTRTLPDGVSPIVHDARPGSNQLHLYWLNYCRPRPVHF